MLTLSTHEIANAYVNKPDALCILLNRLVAAKLNQTGPYRNSHARTVSRAIEVTDFYLKEECYDTAVVANNLLREGGFEKHLEYGSGKHSFYFIHIYGTGAPIRRALAQKLLAAPDRKIVVPTVIRTMYNGDLSTTLLRGSAIARNNYPIAG